MSHRTNNLRNSNVNVNANSSANGNNNNNDTSWITSGDRSHPNLVALDGLNPTYPGHMEDIVKAEEAHTNMPIEFEQRLFQIREKQRIFVGDRSHPRLLSLDALELDYPRWHHDFEKAQEYHVHFPDLFEAKISGMIEKQKMHYGDRSHRNLVALDGLNLLYPGHEEDVADAEDVHCSKPFMFQDRLFEIQEKQKMFVGDRSHLRLKALDALRLDYPDWEKDRAKAEQYHARFPELFHGKLQGMKEKQKIHDGNRTHPNLKRLDDIKRRLRYPGHEADVSKAEHAHTNLPQEFESVLFEIRERQNMFEGNRTHPRLQRLDALDLTYPDHDKDEEKAEHYHLKYPELFDAKLSGMVEKQRIFRGNERRREEAERLRRRRSLQLQQQQQQQQQQKTDVADVRRDGSVPDKERHCVICMQFDRTHAFVPCGHLCICVNCVEATMKKRVCPICRQRTTQAIKVYFS